MLYSFFYIQFFPPKPSCPYQSGRLFRVVFFIRTGHFRRFGTMKKKTCNRNHRPNFFMAAPLRSLFFLNHFEINHKNYCWSKTKANGIPRWTSLTSPTAPIARCVQVDMEPKVIEENMTSTVRRGLFRYDAHHSKVTSQEGSAKVAFASLYCKWEVPNKTTKLFEIVHWSRPL